MSSSTRLPRRLAGAAVAVAATVAVTAGVTAGTAGAAPKPRLDVSGQGTYTLTSPGTAVITGVAEGRPYSGAYTATIVASDGTLAEPGVCEPGIGTLRVETAKGKFVELRAVGDICGRHVQPPFVATHVFTGSYDGATSSKRPVERSDGFLGLTLATGGVASMQALDS